MVWSVDADDERRWLMQIPRTISSFAESPESELYALDWVG
jgi:hypothetical protein